METISKDTRIAKSSENGTTKKDKIFIVNDDIVFFDPYFFKNIKKDIYIPDVTLKEIFKHSTSRNNRIAENINAFLLALSEYLEFSKLSKIDNNSFTSIKIKDTGNTIFLGKITNYDLPKNRRFTQEELRDNRNKFIENALKIDLLTKMSKDSNKNHVNKFKTELDFALNYQKAVILTKDPKIQILSHKEGLLCENYYSQDVESSKLPKGHISLKITGKIPHELFLDSHKKISASLIAEIKELDLDSNVFIEIEDSDGKEISVFYYHEDSTICRLLASKDRELYGIRPLNKEQEMAAHLILDNRIKIICLRGIAGTGKTLIAFASALAMRSNYSNIYGARPAVNLSNGDMGFLPGTIDDKYAPYTQPMKDNLSVIQKSFDDKFERGKSQDLKKMQENNYIIFEPLIYIRGRSIPNVILILDEAQNLTPHEMKTIFTRMGTNSKIIVAGDIGQIDSPLLTVNSNGMSHVIHRYTDSYVRYFGTIELIEGERSEISKDASKLLG